ncbi:hypothetical protein FE257_000383 [Aspergillus nanangensis]|uniref:Rhamnogalacturonase A/B/Epimerase-like pectate lyase domain-containing protein n=1 Tax=Aspergillus nanangensis TaxID=2582783 RepID=A0AAD4CU70_ASPNN|nr:hypothetical protein FE257_000383 [Aspergillus nanangensis]
MARSTCALSILTICLLFVNAWAIFPFDSLFGVDYFPPLDWTPHPTGIPFPLKAEDLLPWLHTNDPPDIQNQSNTEDNNSETHNDDNTDGNNNNSNNNNSNNNNSNNNNSNNNNSNNNINNNNNNNNSHNNNKPHKGQQATCSAGSGTPGYWYEHIQHNGQSSFLQNDHKETYSVFRNVVTDFKADNSGTTDSSVAIQNAIEAGSKGGPTRSSHKMGTTGQPAIVYIPGGLYVLKSALQMYVGTVLVGDPTNPPVFKAAAGFSGDHIIYAKDPNFGGTVNFYIGIKNIVLDSTALDPGLSFALLDWTVSQATQLSNVGFNMPLTNTTHIGLTTQYDYNSNIMLNDLWFTGGKIGMQLNGQQWVFRNLRFKGTSTGVMAGGTNIVFVDCHFEEGKVGINATSTSGSLTVVDSTGANMDTLIIAKETSDAGNAIILENIENSGKTVDIGGNRTILNGNVQDTWVHGTLYIPGSAEQQATKGRNVQTERSSPLLSGNKYFTMAPPTYQEYSASETLNIKSVTDKPVEGDGETDDTQNINAILAQYHDCKVIYFPAGTYIVTDTIFVPAGVRIVGDAFASTISAVGDKFKDPSSVRAMVRLGYPGDTGVIQVTDMLFTVADILPGCQMVEVNIAGHKPGDVGFWNTHFRIGGAVGSKIERNCAGSPANCKAAWGLLHLTSTSSAYIENMWGWTADHDLDGAADQRISTGRGLLVEATAATWLIGTGFEHHTLYQYNFHKAKNVFAALQQSETPYWQGPGNLLAPAPWAEQLVDSDPDFSQCAPNDATCRMALFERINQSSEIFLYGGCNWAFFNNQGDCNGKCQKNTIQILDSRAVYLYGTNTKSTGNMILEGNQAIAKEDDNAGGWGGVIAAFLYNA